MSITRMLNILTVVSAVLALYFDYTGKEHLYRIFKPITTILILLIPFLHRSSVHKKYTSYISIALIFCLLGDIFLLDDSRFIFGLGSFLIAHILFTIGFVSVDSWKTYILPLIILLAYGAGFYTILYNGLDDLAIPVLIYILFILMMSWQGISLYIWRKNNVFRLIAIAAILFMISDSIIALKKFVIPFEASGILILSTYWISISLLANSVVLLDKSGLSNSENYKT